MGAQESAFSCFRQGTISAMEISSTSQSAKGVAQVMPLISMTRISAIINATSKLHLRSRESGSGCALRPVAWKMVIAMKLTAVDGQARQMIFRKLCP